MARDIRRKTQSYLVLILGSFFFIALMVLSNILSRTPLNSYNGVLNAIQLTICLVMVFLEEKREGLIASSILLITSMGVVLNAYIRLGNINALAGLANSTVYLILLYVVSNANHKRLKMIVTDSLTGVANSRGLYAIMRRLKENNKHFYVVTLNLMNYRLINDNYGHEYADQLIQMISKDMQNILGKKGIVTRLSGAEFVLVVYGEHDVSIVANHILDYIREKKTIQMHGMQRESFITAHAGIASFPEDASHSDELLKCADMALRYAISQKTASACIYDKNVFDYEDRREQVEQMIRKGLSDELFYMVYQPQFKAKDKTLRGFESLIRLKTKDGDIISPGEFIPVAEKSSLIQRIDDYVLRKVMKETRDWVVKNPSVIVSVNISSGNVSSEHFIEKVKDYLEETQFPAKNLEIEITEYSMVRSVDTTIQNIEALKELGVQIALDDFGTGYTSLSYLAKMPINLLKIDKSLVDDIETNTKSRDFFNAIVSMGHMMGCEVISEGVEEEGQLSYVREYNCDLVQGYIWSKPLSYEDAGALITE